MSHKPSTEELIAHIAKILERELTEFGFDKTVERIITLYYLRRDYKTANWSTLAVTVYEWETNEGAFIETFENVEEVLGTKESGQGTLIGDILNP